MFYPLYQLYDLQHAMLAPAHLTAEGVRTLFQHPANPLSYTRGGRTIAAGAELLERMTRRFGKPHFGLKETVIDGVAVPVHEVIAATKPFCTLLHFERVTDRKDPKVLIVAPVSGHYATLLRGTVETMLPDHDVYITDWVDAKMVSLKHGKFDLEDYIDYVIEFIRLLGPDVHVIAVCQPAVPVLAAVSVMADLDDPCQARSMTLMGGPIDVAKAATQVSEMAIYRSINWFERSVITVVPPYYPGAFRRVYPGFIQLSSFISMNMERHISAHFEMYQHLVKGDGESAELQRKFYDEYMSVMDMAAEFYLQTVDLVFQKRALAAGTFPWHDRLVKPQAIKKTALLTVEGEFDDISAPGQTKAAHDLCTGLPAEKKRHHFQEKVGHYGIFNGRKWRENIAPVVKEFISQHDS